MRTNVVGVLRTLDRLPGLWVGLMILPKDGIQFIIKSQGKSTINEMKKRFLAIKAILIDGLQ